MLIFDHTEPNESGIRAIWFEWTMKRAVMAGKYPVGNAVIWLKDRSSCFIDVTLGNSPGGMTVRLLRDQSSVLKFPMVEKSVGGMKLAVARI